MKNGGVLLQYVYFLFCWFYLSKTLTVIYLFKLLRLLHDRIDPTVELLRKKPPILECKKAQSRDNTSSVLPIGVPSWCLNQEALKRFNYSNVNISVYDYDTDNVQDNSDNDIDDESNKEDDEIPNRKNRKNSSKRKKRKSKKNKKQKKNKKHKSK